MDPFCWTEVSCRMFFGVFFGIYFLFVFDLFIFAKIKLRLFLRNKADEYSFFNHRKINHIIFTKRLLSDVIYFYLF